MMNRIIFEKIGLFDENLKICEDYDLWLRVSLIYEIGYINEKLVTKYAGHSNQLSFSSFGLDRFRIEALEKHINSKYKKEVLSELIKKSKILINGALKRNNQKIIEEYQKRLDRYSFLLSCIK